MDHPYTSINETTGRQLIGASMASNEVWLRIKQIQATNCLYGSYNVGRLWLEIFAE
jgi:hypothetical protein